MRFIRSMYWTNVDPRIISGQAQVLAKLGLTLRQDERTGMRHGDWLSSTLDELGDDDTILLLDIDCIPLDAAIVETAFAAAEAGRVFGVAHVANHRNPDFIYAGPMFLCLSRKTWDALGRPNLVSDKHNRVDVGGMITRRAQELTIPVDLIYPNFCAVASWPMAGWGAFGIATLYGGRIFHLFESRRDPGYVRLFDHTVEAVLADRPIDPVWMFQWANSWAVTFATLWRKFTLKLAHKREKLARRYQAAPAPQQPKSK